MRERPILMSAPMVRAILEGRKTQTRRVVKKQPPQDLNDGRWYADRYNGGPQWCWWGKPGTDVHNKVAHHIGQVCPYGQPGDRLWVRESFCLEGGDDYALEESRYPRDGRPVRPNNADDDSTGWMVPWYRATDGEPNIVPDDLPDSSDDRTRWKPSIHMPRWASRITLEVTEVRVQRLQDISPEGILAEGVDNGSSNPSMGERWANMQRMAWTDLWDSINGQRPGCAWGDNPWVWAVSFKKEKP